MKLFYTVNVSNPSRLETDSGLIFGRLVISSLLQRGHSVVTFGAAPLPDIACRHYASPTRGNKYSVRFGAPYRHLVDALSHAAPSHVLVNQPEIVPQIRAALAEAGVVARVATYCHYVPFHAEGKAIVDCPSLADKYMGIAVRLAFLAGLQASDLAFVHSAKAAEWVKHAAEVHRVPIGNIVVAPPPRDPLFVCADRRDITSPPTVLYNHRLYSHYGADALLRLGDALASEAGAEVKVMDILGERSTARRNLDPFPDMLRDRLRETAGFSVVTPTSRQDYRRHLESSLACLAPLRRNCTWSMSCIDAQGLGVPLVAPDFAWFADHVPAEMRFATLNEAAAIVRRLVEQPAYTLSAGNEARRSTDHLDPMTVAGIFESALLRT